MKSGCAMLFAILLLAGCRERQEVVEGEDGLLTLGAVEVQQVVTRSADAGNRILVIEGFTGDVQLTGGAVDGAQIEFVTRARGRDDATARANLDRIDIDERGDERTYRYTLRSDRTEMTSVDVRGQVPRNTQLEVRLESGSVLLSGIDGPVTVDNRNGTVRVGGAAGTVDVQTRVGDVEVGLRQLPATAGVRARTLNGNVTLVIPGESDARVDARTQVGGIRVEGLSFRDRRLRRDGAGAHFSGALGQANATVDLSTENGHVELREGRVMMLPLEDTLMAPPYEFVEPDRTLAPDDTLAPGAPPDTTAPPDTGGVPLDTAAAATGSLDA
jgi:hypothetical protein